MTVSVGTDSSQLLINAVRVHMEFRRGGCRSSGREPHKSGVDSLVGLATIIRSLHSRML
jgi:hypothetical protein